MKRVFSTKSQPIEKDPFGGLRQKQPSGKWAVVVVKNDKLVVEVPKLEEEAEALALLRKLL